MLISALILSKERLYHIILTMPIDSKVKQCPLGLSVYFFMHKAGDTIEVYRTTLIFLNSPIFLVRFNNFHDVIMSHAQNSMQCKMLVLMAGGQPRTTSAVSAPAGRGLG